MKKVFLLISSLAMLSACDSAGGGISVDIPNAVISCSSSRCNSNLGAFDAVVTLTKSGCSTAQIDFEDYATGSVSVICGASGCAGTVSSWTEADSATPITTIPAGDYFVCGWIDFDNNGKSINDGFSDEKQSVNGITLTLTDWSAIYSSRKIHPHR